MLKQIIRISDEVIKCVAEGESSQGMSSADTGCAGGVIAYAENFINYVDNYGKKPGVYEMREVVLVNFGTPEVPKIVRMNHANVELVAEDEAQRRRDEFSTWSHEDKVNSETWLRELPETLFLEDDIVESLDPRLPMANPLKISKVDYHNINSKRGDGSPYPIYAVVPVDPKLGGTCFAAEETLKLVQRGRVWDYVHGNPISFENIEDEANFVHRLGFRKEVRNPSNGYYRWTLEQLLQGARDGIVDVSSLEAGFFGSKPRLHAYKFDDEELGKRVRAHMLNSFPLGACGNVALTGIPEVDEPAIAADKVEQEKQAEIDRKFDLLKKEKTE